ncbi:MAG: hypothetical protein D6705_15675 [Deltaproteobacteria bacterium]|nr:MAG: hypothetical protein D6705_15675 [Deltaproteobacteria bacterium]
MTMPRRSFLCRIAAFTAAASVGLAAPVARAGDAVGLVVIREHGVGSAAQAQQYLDRLASAAAKVNGWPAVESKYFTSRKLADRWIGAHRPAFGIMTLGAYLGLRAAYGLKVVGTADVATAGGRRYYVVAKQGGDLSACKGKRLATNFADDPRFVEKVVAAGAFSLSDFTLVPTRRPVQTIHAVIRGDAECALIDDAQFADLGAIEGGAALRPVWTSAEFPPMVVVAFGTADAALVAKFRKNLPKVCAGEGAEACKEVGIRRLAPSSDAAFRKYVKAYGRGG